MLTKRVSSRRLCDYNAFLPADFAFAHLALAICERRLRPAAFIFLLGFAVALSDSTPRCLAHLAFCAAAILALAEALIFRRFRGELLTPVSPFTASTRFSSFWSLSIRCLTAAARRSCFDERSAMFISEPVSQPARLPSRHNSILLMTGGREESEASQSNRYAVE